MTNLVTAGSAIAEDHTNDEKRVEPMAINKTAA
jgi:hypothetical protein